MKATAYIEFIISVALFLFVFWQILSNIFSSSAFIRDEYFILSNFYKNYANISCKYRLPLIINPGEVGNFNNCLKIYGNLSSVCIENNESSTDVISFYFKNDSAFEYYSLILNPSETYCINSNGKIYITSIRANKVCIGNYIFNLTREKKYIFLNFSNSYISFCFIPYRI